MEAGLVDGKKLFADSSLVDANASKNSVTVNMELLEGAYEKFSSRLDKNESLEEPSITLKDSSGSTGVLGNNDETAQEFEKEFPQQDKSIDPSDLNKSNLKLISENSGKKSNRIINRVKVNETHKSRTDPESRFVKDKIYGSTKLRYKVHRSVDEGFEIITSCVTTPGTTNEAHILGDLLNNHRRVLGKNPEIVVADSKYGTKENFVNLKRSGISPHMKDLSKVQELIVKSQGKYCKSDFIYNALEDYYECPGGKRLFNISYNQRLKSYKYEANKTDCSNCSLRSKCTESKNGRALFRYKDEEELELAFQDSRSVASKIDQKKRHHFMERSFAEGKRYGYKRARWRGLCRVSIQQLLVASVQNLMKILRHGHKGRFFDVAVSKNARIFDNISLSLWDLILNLIKTNIIGLKCLGRPV
jgi:IS5 family transposase